MKAPLITCLKWSACSVAIAAAIVAIALAASPRSDAADTIVVPEPAVLIALGIGLSALAFGVRPRRRT
jgi:hypothetical protein